MSYSNIARKITLCASLTLWAVLAGCDACVFCTSEPAVAEVVEIAPEGAIVAPIVCISDIVKDSKAHTGRIAAQGVVSKVFPDRRAFTVVNIVEGASCCASGCGHDSIPARVPMAEYEGDLPAQYERIIIVGEVVSNGEDGFDFVIEEVWAGGKVVLKKS